MPGPQGFTVGRWDGRAAPRRWAAPAACCVGALALGVLAGGDEARAQARLEAQYRVTLGALPIGSGTWTIDVSDNQYVMTATGRSSGLLRAFAGGDGDASVRGVIAGPRITPTTYTIAIRTGPKVDQVRMGLASGTVRTLSVEPPMKPNPKRVPVTDAHKRGVVDPISAGLAAHTGNGSVGPEACRRTISVFDGRQRFDLTLSFKRIEQVRTEQGYQGPAVVCAVVYNPIGGYDRERFATRYLRETRDIELWYAPIAGTRYLAMYRIGIPTVFGTAVMQATRFTAVSKQAGGAPGGRR